MGHKFKYNSKKSKAFKTKHKRLSLQFGYRQRSLQFCSVIQSCLSVCDPVDCSTLGAILSITNSRSLLKLMSIESVIPSNHLIPCHPVLLLPSLFPSIKVFSNESVFASGGQSIGVSTSALFLPMNIQD